MSGLAFALTFLAALGCSLAAGVFFAFSTFVMSGLDRGTTATGIAAMQGINRAAPEPPLMAVLFGSAALCVAVVVVAVLGNAGAGGGYVVAGAVSYLLGVVGVTMVANVPLNERLDKVDAEGPTAAAEWPAYARPWRTWNHVRTLSAFAATAGMVAALAA